MKIGEFVKAQLRAIIDSCESGDHGELDRLLDAEYSKATFNLNFPFCADTDDLPPDLSRRYWSQLHIVRGRTVRVCSQWVDTPRNRELLLKYLTQKGIRPQGELRDVEASSDASIPDVPAPRRRKRENKRYRGNAIGNAQNLVVRNILSSLGRESFTEEDWERTKAEFDQRCAYCGESAKLVIEHAVSINRTALGEHRLGNLVPSCDVCNASKSAKDFREFLGDNLEAIGRIEAHMDRHNYVPLGDNEQVRAVVEMAYREVAQLADRYIAILNGLYGDPEEPEGDV
jgi:5-methylcytosine-specific restriction endonuclease McrA